MRKGLERWNDATNLVIALDKAAKRLTKIETRLKEHKRLSKLSDFHDAEMARHSLAFERLRAKKYLWTLEANSCGSASGECRPIERCINERGVLLWN